MYEVMKMGRYFFDLDYWKRKEREEEEKLERRKKAIRCYMCIWYHKDTMYCPFKKCFKEKWGKY